MLSSFPLSAAANPSDLRELLRTTFGFPAFRANQEEVCVAAVAGRDLLLVMPTGAGKSLCYQLPALARGGTALVISPLIALMEDQASKLIALGLKVARIHSGMDRAASRQACADYLNGDLQFFFIAPERLRVPGFAEMLAKRSLSLIAIDEAHCISQWGHDFRPDYRMLGERLPELRRGNGEGQAAPVLALTATATPTVQADIVAQLGMPAPAKFIHGFRRDNLAIEVVEVPVPMRAAVICKFLKDASRRPAIVYAQSRKQAELLAEELSHVVRASAYHAGLDSAIRESVQRSFQQSEIDVVVATIAFGMGIDKADIRTVIHAGLPATVEGYYQEIGRAGRDGQASRTILMHSYADRRTHDFLLGRDYPPVADLDRVYRLLREEPRELDELRYESKLSDEAFEKAIEKLHIHGGARVDFNGNATVGGPGWKKTYGVQADYRREQLELVVRYVEGHGCRMSALVRHFGDVEDAAQPCGVCDACDPAGAVLCLFRRATPVERTQAQDVIESLRTATYKTIKQLMSDLSWAERVGRDDFEKLLAAMQRAGLLASEEAVFEKDGRVIPYRKISLTGAGLETRATTAIALLLSDGIAEEFAPASSSGSRKRKTGSNAGTSSGKTSGGGTAAPVELSGVSVALAAKLKEWRTSEAKRLRVPPFIVCHDRALNAVAAARPVNLRQLLDVDGIGPAKAEKFGEAILEICRSNP
ncbi:RecQ family ATP-dependent DNA helicase [Terracidiphilus gabretensis]|uniref:RecQ family ATP-dependent DNA helicase n=1 Tax=Terracidiphilus gabretensis TaxID=1577687 RepID=UPI00071BD832|nr:ATP-dependent DNA helicase RecQ [Terracidiphilus gabretensis]